VDAPVCWVAPEDDGAVVDELAQFGQQVLAVAADGGLKVAGAAARLGGDMGCNSMPERFPAPQRRGSGSGEPLARARVTFRGLALDMAVDWDLLNVRYRPNRAVVNSPGLRVCNGVILT
jgi:hypothetical protein